MILFVAKVLADRSLVCCGASHCEVYQSVYRLVDRRYHRSKGAAPGKIEILTSDHDFNLVLRWKGVLSSWMIHSLRFCFQVVDTVHTISSDSITNLSLRLADQLITYQPHNNHGRKGI
jgi:hypothetical protein